VFLCVAQENVLFNNEFVPRYDRTVILVSSSCETGILLFSTVEQIAVCKPKPKDIFLVSAPTSGPISAPQLPRDRASTLDDRKIASSGAVWKRASCVATAFVRAQASTACCHETGLTLGVAKYL
jgi:hypothetical protein